MIRTGRELRQAYLEFFRDLPNHPHPVVASAPLVPPDDPTLLFTTAGMVQFKQLYSGTVDPLPYPRAVTCQKCLRAGGKGSDLENVGRTLRHHTFFEMLGNFSFGDYFKHEAVRYAWQFVTEVMKLPPERLFPTIFEDDDEAEEVWRQETGAVYTPVRLDASQNFWGPAGDTGACGPCSELCIFLGSDEELARMAELAKSPQGRVELARRIDEEGDLFLEIWNMVFPQFDQQKDGSRLPLRNRGIDTGAGLERMTVALTFARTGIQTTPYETDLMWPIVEAASQRLSIAYRKVAEPQDDQSTRERLTINAIADHTRALVFTLAEGLMPSNVGRGYVLRRIQRRALRFASLLGINEPFMADLYDAVADTLGDVYTEIRQNPDFIRKALRKEEETFLHTRDRGMKMLDELMDRARERDDRTIPGEEAFRLWDTYGFPVDLTVEIAEEAGLAVERGGFDQAMARQKEEARKSWKGAKFDVELDLLDETYERFGATEFRGYETPGPVETDVLAILHRGTIGDHIGSGDEALVVLRATPFYAEAGGQVGDTGVIENGGGLFRVEDTQKSPHGLYIHRGRQERGVLKVGETVTARIDAARREAIRRNHSSVHLLQSALKRLVGEHVTQAGSWVGPNGSRFDFTHTEGLQAEQLETLQLEVNRLIAERLPVETRVMALEEAKKSGAIAPFGEKYGALVRVVTMGDASTEFCGGTHVANTGEILHYRIEGESSIASGIRRIEATTGLEAGERERMEHYRVVLPLETAFAAKGEAVVERVQQLQARVKELEKELGRLKEKLATTGLDKVAAEARRMDGARLAIARLEGVEGGALRGVAHALLGHLGAEGIAVVASEGEGKVALACAVGEGARSKYPAGTIIRKLAEALGGKGGGKPDYAQGGGKDIAALDRVIETAPELLAAE